jgi:hypothetical protein
MIKHLEIIEILESMQVNEADIVGINTNVQPVVVASDYQAMVYVKNNTPTADLLRWKYTFNADPESKIERADITAHHLDGNSYTFLLRIL